MKKIVIIIGFFFLMVSQFAFGQGYQTIHSSVTSTFSGNTNKQVESIRIDSSFVEQGDSIFYPFYNIQQIDYDCFFPFSYSWIGKKIIIKPDGYNYFINRENDTIKINTLAQLNETWIAYQTSTIIIMAEVIKHDMYYFLEQGDSAKTISFTANDQDTNFIPNHPINDMTIIVSEHFGLLKTINFSLFPEKTIYSNELQTYNLVGLSSPQIGIVNLTWREIYDFDIGDEIHVIYAESIPFSSVEEKKKYIYLDKTIFSNSITYRLDREIQMRKSSPEGTEYTYRHDTITQTYNANSKYLLEKLSGETIGSSDEYTATEIRMRMDNIPKKIYNPYMTIYNKRDDSCWHTIIMDGCFHVDTYLKGLGGAYYSCDYYPFYHYSNELKYYKKGDIIWGTPLSISNLQEYKDSFVKIYPNPTTGQLRIDNGQWTIDNVELFDVYGRKAPFNSHEGGRLPSFGGAGGGGSPFEGGRGMSIDISHLPSGVYFLKINNEVVKKIIKE